MSTSTSVPRTAAARWFLREPSPEGAARLFCLPYSGCGATMYRNWPRFLGDIEICRVQPPGRENRTREAAYETYEQLADDLAEVLLPYLDRPFAFFGHCGSALPGYETTVRLLQRGYPMPLRLFVSSQAAPHQGPTGRAHGRAGRRHGAPGQGAGAGRTAAVTAGARGWTGRRPQAGGTLTSCPAARKAASAAGIRSTGTSTRSAANVEATKTGMPAPASGPTTAASMPGTSSPCWTSPYKARQPVPGSSGPATRITVSPSGARTSTRQPDSATTAGSSASVCDATVNVSGSTRSRCVGAPVEVEDTATP